MNAEEKHIVATQVRHKISDMIRALDEHEKLIFETRDSGKLKRLREDLMDLSCDLSRFLT